MSRWKLAIAVVAVAATIGGGTAAARPDGHSGWKVVKVRFTPSILAINTADPACDTEFQCVSVSTITATQSGDLQGSTAQGLTVALNGTDVIPQAMTGTFTGNVNGCGAGAFLYRGNGVGSTTTLRYTTTYTIVLGSGAGDLSGITGVMMQEGSLTDVTPAPITGTFRCRA